MKHVLFICSMILISISVNSQVTWKFTAKKIADKTYELHFNATVDEPWHIYSQGTPKGGPLPTSFVFKKNPVLSLVDKPKEVGEIEVYHDHTFKVDVFAFKDSVDFVQTVKLKSAMKTNISGSVTYMACTKQQCLKPETLPFNLKLD
ncbi:MAG: protein-disulfide reductase DsbD domain-containing protein [Bacteroidota bacterium]